MFVQVPMRVIHTHAELNGANQTMLQHSPNAVPREGPRGLTNVMRHAHLPWNLNRY